MINICFIISFRDSWFISNLRIFDWYSNDDAEQLERPAVAEVVPSSFKLKFEVKVSKDFFGAGGWLEKAGINTSYLLSCPYIPTHVRACG